MVTAAWSTVQIVGDLGNGRAVVVELRAVAVEYADGRRAALVPWWPRWAAAAGSLPVSLS